MMSKTDRHSSAEPNRPNDPRSGDVDSSADWSQLEAFVDQLYELAQSKIDVEEFYRELVGGCVTLLAAEGGVVWLPATPGRWRAVHPINSEQVWSGHSAANEKKHAALLRATAVTAEPQLVLPCSRVASGEENPTSLVLAFATVHDAGTIEPAETPHAIVELFLRPGSSPAVQQGWRELLQTVAQIAADFHLREQLRNLRDERGCYDLSIRLMRRFQQTTDLRQMAFEIANEGRRFVAADRLCVVVRRGSKWQVLAASGVDRIEARADVTKRLEQLAATAAEWGEPLEYADASAENSRELPPSLAELVERHIDESQARRLIVAPVELIGSNEDEQQSRQKRAVAVLVAEHFTSGADELSRQRVFELARLCEPAINQVIKLDRFPLRGCLRWADWCQRITEKWGLTKLAMATVAAAIVVAALIFVPIDFEVEAPATLRPTVERDVFATTDGKVTDVRITHGEVVAAGDVLAVLHDPQLALDTERVEGEIATMRKRMEAIAVARTDRQVREETNPEKLPLSAEAEQLEKRLDSLRLQQEILTQRREALTLRSPIAGTVLTLDVLNLLRTRPVERGQVLFTVADTSAGWRLVADLPQDRVGQVVAAQQSYRDDLPVRFRLADETERTFVGHVKSISTAAVLETAQLDQASPAFEVCIDVDDDLLGEGNLPIARPGMSAQVRVHCGRRSLGYVWLHDIWETAYSWLVF